MKSVASSTYSPMQNLMFDPARIMTTQNDENSREIFKGEKKDPMRGYLATIISSQRHGRSCLPFLLGLNSLDFVVIVQHFFKDDTEMLSLAYSQCEQTHERSELRQELLEIRNDEWYELRKLLRSFRRGQQAFELYIADIVAAACLGGDHLWRDLGMANRFDLTGLIKHTFPSLASLNSNDMRWKKFLYKQICEQQGGYICRSPSCDQCPTYELCFGVED